MSVLLFILVLVVLIVVHEFGHFVVAKLAKMRVEEFGIGYPPRALTYYRKDGTDYTLNWLPFGGFVKIYGEDDSEGGKLAQDSFVAKPRTVQALVLLAGIFMNLAFAWVLFSIVLGIGMPRALSGSEVLEAENPQLLVSRVVAGSPAQLVGLVPGDEILGVRSGDKVFNEKSAEAFTEFVAGSKLNEPLYLTVLRGEETIELSAQPVAGIVPGEAERLALGVGVASVGTVASPWWRAPIDGFFITVEATKQIAIGLYHFFAGLLTFSADLSQVAGPVGIAGAVGDASASGIVPLLMLTAIISINLALVNLIPVPALDGGRLLFVIIEAIIRKPIPQGVAGTVNTVGFALLILLMVVITANDILKLFG